MDFYVIPITLVCLTTVVGISILVIAVKDINVEVKVIRECIKRLVENKNDEQMRKNWKELFNKFADEQVGGQGGKEVR